MEFPSTSECPQFAKWLLEFSPSPRAGLSQCATWGERVPAVCVCLQSWEEGGIFRSTRETSLGLDGKGLSGGIWGGLKEGKAPLALRDS